MEIIRKIMSLFEAVITRMKYRFLIFCSCMVLICLMVKIIGILNGFQYNELKTALSECYLFNNYTYKLLERWRTEKEEIGH